MPRPFGMSLTETELQEIDALAQKMADAARAVILPYFRSMNLAQDNKLAQGYDPVTEADRAAEREMRRLLMQLRPHDAILGEELGRTSGSSGLTWVLDPIDGTRGLSVARPRGGY